MTSTVEIVLTIIGMSFWFLFPIGMFLSVSRLDKNTDQIIQLEHLRHHSVQPERPIIREERYVPIPFDWHHPIIFFRRWLEH